MNIALNLGTAALAYLYPPLGVPLAGMRWLHTLAKIASGNVAGGFLDVLMGARPTCEEARDICLEKFVFDGAPMFPSDAQNKGYSAIACWASYFICKGVKFIKR